MKKIVIGIMVLVITFGLLGIGAYGVFALPEDTNNTDHGQLSLSVLGRNTANETYFFRNIKPGDSWNWDGSQNTGGMSWTVKNTGSLDGSLEISIVDLNDNASGLSSQIMPRLLINDSVVSESSNLAELPVFHEPLASGQEIKVDIAWKFKEIAGNEYQGANTTCNVKFYITAPSPATIPASPTVTPVTAALITSLEVDAFTEPGSAAGGISVLGFTGLNPVIPITGLTVLLAGFIAIIAVTRKQKKNQGK